MTSAITKFLSLSGNLAANRPGGFAALIDIKARKARRALRRIALMKFLKPGVAA
jgi:hypothetical protein